jgi:L,D-peptidoglycan transpeptidase YkuD (ErfK/YbiS/YcfS/YnhG family)
MVLTLAVVFALQACPQQVVVTATSTSASTASLSLLECGRRVLGPFRAHVGVNGLSAHRREGDGTTPLGTFALGGTLYGLDPNPGVRLRYHRLRCGDWWDGDPSSPTYNTFRHVACGAKPPFRGRSEPLWRNPVAYREFAFIEYNAKPAVPGLGSAIFLHDDKGSATNGCISIARSELLRVLRRLRAGATIAITA